MLILYYIAIILAVILLIAILPILLQSYSVPDAEKTSAYECGFEPFGDARDTFDIHFYLVGIIFIIFDIEIVFLLPWVIIFDGSFNLFMLFVILCFIFVVGFVYEYNFKILDWNKLRFN